MFYDPRIQAYIDPILTNFSIGYATQFPLIGDTLFPMVDVALPTGKYRVFDRSNRLIFASHREPGGVTNEVRAGKFSIDTFTTQEHALQASIADEERQWIAAGNANAATSLVSGLDPETDSLALITRSVLYEHELKASTLARTTGSYASGMTTALSGTARWDNQTPLGTGGTPDMPVSNPVLDIQTGVRAITAKIGRPPNKLIIPWDVWTWLPDHPRIVKRFQYFDLTRPDAFRLLTGFDGEIVIANSEYNDVNNENDTENITKFWGKDVILAYVEDQPQQLTQTWGKTFTLPYANGERRPVTRWRRNETFSDVVHYRWRYDLKITSNVCAYLIQTAVS